MLPDILIHSHVKDLQCLSSLVLLRKSTSLLRYVTVRLIQNSMTLFYRTRRLGGVRWNQARKWCSLRRYLLLYYRGVPVSLRVHLSQTNESVIHTTCKVHLRGALISIRPGGTCSSCPNTHNSHSRTRRRWIT
jgi:hypothetical protein